MHEAMASGVADLQIAPRRNGVGLPANEAKIIVVQFFGYEFDRQLLDVFLRQTVQSECVRR
jgi:hypothetical protein